MEKYSRGKVLETSWGRVLFKNDKMQIRTAVIADIPFKTHYTYLMPTLPDLPESEDVFAWCWADDLGESDADSLSLIRPIFAVQSLLQNRNDFGQNALAQFTDQITQSPRCNLSVKEKEEGGWGRGGEEEEEGRRGWGNVDRSGVRIEMEARKS